MNKRFLYYSLVVIVFFIGVFLRFYQLGNIPNALDWDEAAWGYNAYSILHTGKDEYGVSFPISFKSFGDYKQPIYMYSEVPGIALFGLDAFSVRLPSAVYGSFSSIVVFFLVLELFYRHKHKKELALIAMAVFALSPWSIQFSRIAFEATLGVFFVLLGLYLFLLGVRKNSFVFFTFSAISFALSAYSYHSEKLFMPLFLIALFILFYKYFVKRKYLNITLLVIVFITNALWLFNGTTTARGASVLFTSNQTQLLKSSASAIIYDSNHHDKLGIFLNNRRFVYLDTFFLNYLKHWDPNWFFISGDIVRHHAPGMGLLYLASLPFILFGLFVMFRDKYENRFIILIWFLLAPIASAIAIDAPNAERSLIMLPPIVLWEAIGLMTFYQWCREKSKQQISRNMLLLIVICFYVFNIMYYINQYFAHTNFDKQQYWQYGYQQVVDYTNQSEFANKRIIFSSEFEQPYIFYLFYSQYDPQTYLQRGGSIVKNNTCFSINNRYFGNCQKLLRSRDVYVTLQNKPALPSKKLTTFNYLNGSAAASVYQIK